MSLDTLINLLVTVTLIEMMVLIGLRVTFAELAGVVEERRLLAQTMAGNYVLVPGLAVLLLLWLDVNPMVAAGVLVLAVCPGAPFGPPFANIARGNVAVAAGLMLILAGSSAIVSPMLLNALLPWLADGVAPRIDLAGMVSVLLITQLLPLLLGLIVRHRHAQLADRLVGPLEFASRILNLAVAGLILATQFQLLTQIKALGFLGMLILIAGSLAIGWLAGGPGRDRRRTVALTTSLRNVGIGLVIVTGNFAGTPAVSAALAYGIFEVFGSLLMALWWRRSAQPALNG